MTVATIVTALIVLYQNYVLRQTLDEMRTQSGTLAGTLAEMQAQTRALAATLVEMEQQTQYAKDVAKATMTATVAARDSLNDNRKAFRLEMRPYVVVKSVVIKDLAPQTRFSVAVQITNNGRTPASRVMMLGRLEISKSAGGPPRPMNRSPYNQMNASIGSLGTNPDQVLTLAHFGPDSLSKEMFDAIENGNSWILVHGQVSYYDIFRDGEPNTSDWCFYYDYIRTKQMVSCTEWNGKESLQNTLKVSQ
ncbi:MAG: hypothetical protein MN733_29515 [Nitrososphaera sp.]|nr:hypothetical protein [Nitrososphaera sp.]